jgi:hypothetical protein
MNAHLYSVALFAGVVALADCLPAAASDPNDSVVSPQDFPTVVPTAAGIDLNHQLDLRRDRQSDGRCRVEMTKSHRAS